MEGLNKKRNEFEIAKEKCSNNEIFHMLERAVAAPALSNEEEDDDDDFFSTSQLLVIYKYSHALLSDK